MTVAAPWVPLCMEPDEWSGWQSANARLNGTFAVIPRALRPCEDCPMGYAADMRAEGRCNGEPSGVDHDEQETEQMDQTTTKAPDMAPTSRTTIAVATPCPGCAHAPVCRIQPELALLTTVRVDVPALADGARLALTGTIECDWFAKAKGAPREADAEKPKRGWSPEQREAAAERARQMMAARKSTAAQP